MYSRSMSSYARQFVDNYAMLYGLAPVQWLAGALLLPGTRANAAAAALSVAARSDLDSAHDSTRCRGVRGEGLHDPS